MTEPDSSMSQPAPGASTASASADLSSGFEVTLIEALAQLVEHRRLIGIVTGAAMLLGLLYCLALPALYTATTKIMTPQQTQSSAAMLMTQLANSGAGSLAAAAGSGFGLKNPNDVYIGLLGSRSIADALIQQFGLQGAYKTVDMTAARKTLAASTQMTSEKSGFLSITVTDRDRQRAAEIANAYTSQLRILTKTLAVTEASQRRLFYEEQLRQAKDSLVYAELAFQQVQQNKGLVQLDAQAKAMIEGLADLRAQIAAKQVDVQGLRSYSTEKNPDLQLAESQLSTLQAEQARMEQRNGGQGIAGLGLENVPSAGLEYLRAQHELQYRQALYDMLLKQLDAAKLDEAKDAAVIQVVEPAIAPDRKSSPKRLMIVLTFMIAGFIASCVLVRIVWWKNVLKSAPDIVNALAKLKSAYRS
jgi:uncharacterized protein involved in exopolysaccharide biosynthesis